MSATTQGQERTDTIGNGSGALTRRIWTHAGWLLILAAIAVMPMDEGAFNTAMAVLGVAGLITIIREPNFLRDGRLRLVIVLLLCIWVPMVISLIGAAEPWRAARTVAAFLRFPFAAVFVVAMLRDATARKCLPLGTFAVMAVWCLDGLIQWWFGRNILGFPYDGVNLTGLFYPKRIIGLLLAVLFPIALEVAWTTTRRSRALGIGAWLIVATMPLIVLLGGSRTSWMMIVVATGCWMLYRYIRSAWRYKTVAMLAAIVFIGAAVPVVLQMPGLETRLEQTSKLFQGDYDAINDATSGRLPIWEIAVAMWKDHWLIGVGPRGYRYLYPDYADDDTPWISPDGQTGGAHPHQTTLEVMVETGIIGLLGYVLFWMVLTRAMLRCPNDDAWPWAMAVLVAMFPLNVHMAIYGTYWSHFSWWLIMVMAGMMGDRGGPSDTRDRAPSQTDDADPAADAPS